MRLKLSGYRCARLLTILFTTLLLLTVGSMPLAQDENDEETVSGDPVMLGLAVAREIIEEERDKPLLIVRWRYYEDNWSIESSWQLYGSFGIDNCVAEIPILLKRGSVLFGWTFSILDVSGKEYQARVSYDLAESVICDDVHVPPLYAPVAIAQDGETAVSDAVTGPANAGPAGFALGGHIAIFDATALSLMNRAGMSWVKKQVHHGITDGRDLIQQAHANGLKVLLGAVGNKGELAQDFDGYVARFAEYVAFLAQNGADAIEVWNEPNLHREWPQGQINGAQYVKMLKAAYEAIKAANPRTLVISGAPSPTGGAGSAGCTAEGTFCNDDVFMQQMAQAGAAQYMDCLGLHYNEGIVSPTQNSGDPRNYYPTQYFNSMLFRGAQFFPNSKVCWTELGYLSPEGMGSPLPGSFSWAHNVTVAQHAQWLAEAARLSRDSGRVSLMIVWNLNFSVWGSDPQGGYAMLRPGGGCPACDSLGAVIRG